MIKKSIKILKTKISKDNLLLLDVTEENSEYYLQKLYDWQEEYDYVDWNEFKDSWILCTRCKSYTQGGCICYAR